MYTVTFCQEVQVTKRLPIDAMYTSIVYYVSRSLYDNGFRVRVFRETADKVSCKSGCVLTQLLN